MFFALIRKVLVTMSANIHQILMCVVLNFVKEFILEQMCISYDRSILHDFHLHDFNPLVLLSLLVKTTFLA